MLGNLLLCKHKDPSSVPSTSVKQQTQQARSGEDELVQAVLARRGQVADPGAHQPGSQPQQQAPDARETPAQKKGGQLLRNDT